MKKIARVIALILIIMLAICQSSLVFAASTEINKTNNEEDLIKLTEYYIYDDFFEAYRNYAELWPNSGDAVSTEVEFDSSLPELTYVNSIYYNGYNEEIDDIETCFVDASYNSEKKLFTISNQELKKTQARILYTELLINFIDEETGNQYTAILCLDFYGEEHIVDSNGLNIAVGEEYFIAENNKLYVEQRDKQFEEDVTVNSIEICSDEGKTININKTDDGWTIVGIQDTQYNDSATIKLSYTKEDGTTNYEVVFIWVYAFWPGDIRIAGVDRYYTSFYIAETLKDRIGSFGSVVVATGVNYPDALTGDYLANLTEAPMLLIGNDTNSQNMIANFITENLSDEGTIYILGDDKVVSESFENKLIKLRSDSNIIRLAGSDRYKTNLKILEEAEKIVSNENTWNNDINRIENSGNTIIITTGTNYADALSASSVNIPIMLSSNDSLTKEQLAFIEQYKIDSAYIAGDSKAVGVAIEEQLKGNGIDIIERFAGIDRFDTSARMAEYFYGVNGYYCCTDAVVLTTGYKFPDGLSGGPLAFQINAPVLLVGEDKNTYSYAKHFVKNNDITHGVVLGADNTVSDKVVSNVMGWDW